MIRAQVCRWRKERFSLFISLFSKSLFRPTLMLLKKMQPVHSFEWSQYGGVARDTNTENSGKKTQQKSWTWQTFAVTQYDMTQQDTASACAKSAIKSGPKYFLRLRWNNMEIEQENGVLILRDMFPVPGLRHKGAEGETVFWGRDKGCKEGRQSDDICQVSGLVMEETTWLCTRETQSYLRAGEVRSNEKSGWQTDGEREKRRKGKTVENMRQDEGDTKKEGSCGKQWCARITFPSHNCQLQTYRAPYSLRKHLIFGLKWDEKCVRERTKAS